MLTYRYNMCPRKKDSIYIYIMGRGGALAESWTFKRRVFGSTPALKPRKDLGQVIYLQLHVRFGVKLRYSIRAVVGSAYE